jgi:predicted P-loop ATPase
MGRSGQSNKVGSMEPLNSRDLAAFQTFGIPPDLLSAAQIARVNDQEARELLALNGSHGDYAGIFFPYFHPKTGYRITGRVRRDFPEIEDGKPKNKYLAGYGDRRAFYYPPYATELLDDLSVPIILVEAEKSALAITALAKRSGRRFITLAMGGCYGWRGRIGKTDGPNGERLDEVGPIPDLDHCTNRKVYVILDSNVLSNPRVRLARRELLKVLKKKKANIVLAIDLPGEAENINGPDDFIARKGDAAFLRLLEASPKMTSSSSSASAHLLTAAIALLRNSEEWQGVLAFDEFALRTLAKKPTPWNRTGGAHWTGYDDSKSCEWLQNAGLSIGTAIAAEAVEVIAKENHFHPVRDYLNIVMWDDEPRIEKWLTTYLGAADSAFVRAAGARWLISAVARVMRPGCQADHVLLLEGPQGIRKSTALRILAGDDWFSDHISELGSKDSRLELLGKWILEIAELDRIRRGELERVKAFVTSRIDNFRLPYGRRSDAISRQCVFAGTVNDPTPLTDESGNRRFWPIRCGVIDIERLAKERDQLWAEAFAQFKAGASWWLDTPELNEAAVAEQEERYNGGALDDIILDWCDDPQQRYEKEPGGSSLPLTPFDSERGRVTITDILIHALGKPLDRIEQRHQNEVVRCLTHHKWKRSQLRINGRRKWFYCRTVATTMESKT